MLFGAIVLLTVQYEVRTKCVSFFWFQVRKRPLNKKETARKEDDIVAVYDDSYLTVHEPKLKVWECFWHFETYDELMLNS